VGIRARPYETGDDLRRMQSLQQELWALEGPRVLTHVGDLAWWLHRPEGKRQLWLEGDRCVAWAWLHRPATLDYEVHREQRELHREVLDWFEVEAEGDTLSTYALESDTEGLDLLAACGYGRPEQGASYAYYVHELEREVPEPAIADGFTLHTVEGEDDFRKRVEVHRAAWEPSRVTAELYRKVTETWPYRADLDCVLEAPDGRFAAYVLCWYDDANRVGEFEPVGTRPDFRRQGLGAAVCRYALRRLQQEGARRAIVSAGGRDEDEGARALYESVGFRRNTRVVELCKERS
jgi:ribosomal protein S18 acetylase RimI-like enzyme